MIRLVLLTTTALALATSAFAQDRVVPNPVRRVQEYVPIDATTGLPITQSGGGSGGGSNAAAGANGATAPASSSSTGYTNAAGNQTPVGPTTPLPTQDANSAADLTADQTTAANTTTNALNAYVLNTNGASTPKTVNGGGYGLNLPSAFNGATITLSQTINGVTSTVATYTATPATAPCLTIGAGTTMTAAATGGTPTGIVSLNATATCPTPVSNTLPAGVDRSSTITTGGTAQNLAVSNTARVFLKGQNISTGDLWINEVGGTAAANTAGSYRIPSGSTFSVSTNRAISIYGATTGQAFTATEG